MSRFFSLAALTLLAFCLATSPAAAKSKTKVTTITTLYAVTAEGIGEPIGTLTLHDSAKGLVLIPKLHGLPPGPHGFHLHEYADCSPGLKNDVMTAAQNAGGHFDPDHSGRHEGPNGGGHRGDLPVLSVNDDGTAQQPLIAPHLKLSDISGHAFVIHEKGDNYSDDPAPLGGGSGRIACGVVL